MDNHAYAMHLEKRLVERFREEFRDKMGYFPTVITRMVRNTSMDLPFITIEELERLFDPFLPVVGERRIPLRTKSRVRQIVELRQMFFHLARVMGYSLVSIGKYIGDRDHTTVMHNVRSFRNLYETSGTYREKFERIYRHIKENYDPSALGDPAATSDQPEPPLFPGLLQTSDQTLGVAGGPGGAQGRSLSLKPA